MQYTISLKTVGLLLGLWLVAAHAFALTQPEKTRRWLTALPRSYNAGVAILAIDLVWAFYLAYAMDWGEFYYLRVPIMFALPVFFFLTVHFVDEFLSVRALGILALLIASPMLDAAFLQPPTSRLLVVVLAYVWIVLGMFWIAQPHLLRDQIGWASRNAARWTLAAGGGVVYGLLLLLCALAWY